MRVFGAYAINTEFSCTVVPIKCDSDVIFCLQLLSKH